MIPDALHPLGRRNWRTTPPLPYDAEVEYLESTGTQYIDTGIKPVASSFGFTGVFSITQATVSNTGGIAGCRGTQSSTASDTYAMAFYDGSELRIDLASKYTFLQLNTSGTNTIVYSRSTTKLNGSSVSNNTKSNCNYSFLLFAMNNSTGGRVMGKVRIHSWKITENGTDVRDLIPVRVGSGASAVGYLYDRANPTGGPLGNGLYGNSGSGAFVVGPDKSP